VNGSGDDGEDGLGGGAGVERDRAIKIQKYENRECNEVESAYLEDH
jgi:hypothetical protein